MDTIDRILEQKNEQIKKLEKENKNLKSERDNCLKEVKLCYNDIHSLEWQISDLEEENSRLKNNAMEDMRVQTKLEEENRKLRERNVKLTWWAISYNSVKERVEKQKEQIEKCKLTLLAINEKLIEEIFWED